MVAQKLHETKTPSLADEQNSKQKQPDGESQAPLVDGQNGTRQHPGTHGSKSTTLNHLSTSPQLDITKTPLDPADEDGKVWDEARRQIPGDSQPDKLQQAPHMLKPTGYKSATNPYFKRKPVAQPSGALPTDEFSKLDIDNTGSSTNPWHPAMNSGSGSTGRSTPQTQLVAVERSEEIESDPWSVDDKLSLLQPNPSSKSPVLISMSTNDEDVSSAWKEETCRDESNVSIQSPPAAMPADLLEEQNVWDDLGTINKGKGKGKDKDKDKDRDKVADVAVSGKAAAIDDWSLIEAGPSSHGSNNAHIVLDTDENKPPLPSRSTALQQKWVPSRQPVDPKAETYQVKNIRWHDPTLDQDLRTSPILIQNENGPCPLVALVNALTLTTPSDSPETTLVEVLRPREQISLDLLLKAVFDELMSPRRTNSDDALPDVSDLYAFLQGLHTGMNVNPRFVPTPGVVNAYKRTSLTHLHPAEREKLIPGTFENTMEMSLYATFSIPLIHGWLPAPSDPVYGAMERQAVSYEDVQNVLFCEEELTNKLSSDEGLSEDEQQLYQDIITIKMFLDSSATQLTAWGIEVIGKSMRPGSFAILFRNDHFSTLYCHPQTLQLLSLVTDAGYRTHEEVVWETLRDVNGEHTEYLSGDYRVVSSSGAAGPSSHDDSIDNGGRDWTRVQKRGGKDKRQDVEEELPLSPHEQADRDLALALQLQEEEDQRHQEEQTRRLQERLLSEQFIEQQGQRPTPVNRGRRRTSQITGIAPERQSSNNYSIPVREAVGAQSRQSSMLQQHSAPPPPPPPTQQQQQQVIRSLVPPRRPGGVRRAGLNGDDAPPSYEQAAQDPAYEPPMGHPNHSQSSIATLAQSAGISGSGMNGVHRTRSAHSQMMSTDQPPRRQPLNHGNPPNGRDRDCVAM